MKPGKELRINLWDLVSPIADTMDMMSPAVAEHGLRVAYLAMRLGEALSLPPEEQRDLCIAGALHDIGAFSLRERLDLLEFEESRTQEHAAAGYLLLRSFRPFARAASIVRHHHLRWNLREGAARDGTPAPRGSHIVHLADRVAVLIPSGPDVLGRVEEICDSVRKRSGEAFDPSCVDALCRIAGKDYIWLDIASSAMESVLRRNLSHHEAEVSVDALLELARLICRIIDFKSEFTATHSSGVAASGGALARRAGLSPAECRKFEIAAYLHDLGKLAVPSEILEKPGTLSHEEWNVMRTHVYYTYRILTSIEALGEVASWGALHQERLNGSGYPFRYTEDELPLGARIMAVADVFTSLTEDRPYRKAMDRTGATGELRGMAARREIDGTLVALLLANYDEIDDSRARAQANAVREYDAFRQALG